MRATPAPGGRIAKEVGRRNSDHPHAAVLRAAGRSNPSPPRISKAPVIRTIAACHGTQGGMSKLFPKQQEFPSQRMFTLRKARLCVGRTMASVQKYFCLANSANETPMLSTRPCVGFGEHIAS
jgi:hypothetical protein